MIAIDLVRGRAHRRVVGLAWICLLLWGSLSQAYADAYAPEKIKAAYLYHFGSFVEWPEQAQPTNAFTIGVLGASDIENELRHIAPGRVIQGKPVVIRRIRSVADARSVQILFVGHEASERLDSMAAQVRGRPILVVSEVDGGLTRGAAINFMTTDQRVRFEVSLPVAQQAGLGLSSRLLRVALLVQKTGLLLVPWGDRVGPRSLSPDPHA